MKKNSMGTFAVLLAVGVLTVTHYIAYKFGEYNGEIKEYKNAREREGK